MIHDTKTSVKSAGPVWLFTTQQSSGIAGPDQVRHGIWTVDNLHCRVAVHGTNELFSATHTLYGGM